MTLTTLQLSKGGTVSFRSAGRGEPLVLLHGVGLQSAAWGPQIDALQDQFRVIAVDLPGHGGSDPLPAGSQLPMFVEWCGTVLQALGLGAVNLAGHSMGALIAAGVTVRFPERVSRVSMLNGVYCRDAKAADAVTARAAQIAAGHVDLQAPLVRWFDDSPSEIAARDDVAAWLGDVDTGGYATAYGAFAGGDATYANRMHEIACPFLALTGDGDPNSTPAMSDAMAAAVQNGRSVTLTGQRHMANLTAPDAVTAHLLDWLNMPVQEGDVRNDVA